MVPQADHGPAASCPSGKLRTPQSFTVVMADSAGQGISTSPRVGTSEASETEIPFLTSAAAALRFAGVIRFNAPRPSSFPHRLQFDSSFCHLSYSVGVTNGRGSGRCAEMTTAKTDRARTATPRRCRGHFKGGNYRTVKTRRQVGPAARLSPGPVVGVTMPAAAGGVRLRPDTTRTLPARSRSSRRFTDVYLLEIDLRADLEVSRLEH